MTMQDGYLVKTKFLQVALAQAYAERCQLSNDAEDVLVYRSNWGRHLRLLLDKKLIVERNSHGLPFIDCPPLSGYILLQDICAYGAAKNIPYIPIDPQELAAEIGLIEKADHKPSSTNSQGVPAQGTATPAPTTGKRWTKDFIEDVRGYRATHTDKQTGEKYGVSGSLVRRKLATPKKAKAQPFSGLGSRAK